MTTTENMRPKPFFIADNQALNFLNSIAEPAKIEYDWLSDGEDLLNWLIQAGLASIDDIAHFKRSQYKQECDNVALQARHLREWLRDFMDSCSALPNVDLSEIKIINDILGQDNSYTQIEKGTETKKTYFFQRLIRRFHIPRDLLLPIAESIADLICNKDFTQVKKCQGATCTMWFLDISKNHSRSWCSMAVCGNRAKAAQYRLRKKQAKLHS